MDDISQDNKRIPSRRLLIIFTKLHSVLGRSVVESLLFSLTDYEIDLFDENKSFSLDEIQEMFGGILGEGGSELLMERLRKELSILDSLDI